MVKMMEDGRPICPGSGDMSGLDEDAISTRPLESDSEFDSDIGLSDAAIPAHHTQQQAIAEPGPTSPSSESAFTRLPRSVIELILWLSDPNSFASLVILNRQWNAVSQNAPLYAYHLSNCPSYALSHYVITKPSELNDLRCLKVKFAQEVRRNLFEAFMQPSETMVNLISTSANSSAAFPRGEALRFVFSSQGLTLLALSSTRIFVIDLLSEPLTVKRELKTMRRPVAAAITNDGSLLALLSTKHQVNIYGLTETGVSHLQVIILDNPPRTIALANEGTVLAAAYEGGVEVFSLAANALSTDRRAVRCEAVDSMSFSSDGSTLLGSSYDTGDSNTVVITAPFYTENDPNVTTKDLHSRMWTTQILFPQNSSTCSHAVVLNSHTEADITWLFVYDRSLNTYRAVRADDTRTGVVYFLGPDRRRHSIALPNMLPSISMSGELAVAGFSGAGLYLYGIPEKVDNAPDMSHVFQREERSTKGLDLSLTSATGYREPLMVYSPPVSEAETIEDDFLSGSVDWRQSLFVRSRSLTSLEGAVAAAWVEEPSDGALPRKGKRLAVVAPGGVRESSEEMYEDYLPVDGGRILLLDFDYAPQGPEKKKMTIEVGEKTPEMLPEQRGSLDVEVDLARRRSMWGMTDPERRWSLGRSVTAIVSPSIRMSTHFEEGGSRTSISQPPSPMDGSGSISPSYVSSRHPRRHSSRSQEHLPRSATTTGVRTARYPPRPPLGSTERSSSGALSSRRTRERRTVASLPKALDDWEAPPPYRRSPDQDLPNWRRFDLASRDTFAQGPRLEEPFLPAQRPKTVCGSKAPSPASLGQASPNSHAAEGHLRGLSEVSAASWLPSGPGQRGRRSSDQMPKAHSVSCSVSPLSSPRSTRFLGRGPSESSLAMCANVMSPMPDIAIPLQRAGGALATPRTGLAEPCSPVVPPLPWNGRPTPTLTGANLQNRLNHPVPPRPSGHSQQSSSPYIPTALRVGQTAAPTTFPPHTTPEPTRTTAAAADQTTNLNLYVASSKRRPLSVSPFVPPAAGPGGQNGPDKPYIPAAEWGPAGVASASAFQRARKSIKHGSRARSRAKPRPDPDLHVPRPQHGGVGPINSVGTDAALRGPSNDPSPLTEPTRHGQRRAATYPRATKSRKHAKGDRVSSEESDGAKKAKMSRCVVM